MQSAAGSRSSPVGSARGLELGPAPGPRPAAQSPGELGAVLAPGCLALRLVGVHISRELFLSSCNCGALAVTARWCWLRVCTPSFLGEHGVLQAGPRGPALSAVCLHSPGDRRRPAFRAGAADLGTQPRAVGSGRLTCPRRFRCDVLRSAPFYSVLHRIEVVRVRGARSFFSKMQTVGRD